MRRTPVGHLSDPARAGFTGWKAGKVSLAVAFACTAGPALAQSFAPPEGCDGFLTVQQRSCYVTNFWRCEAAPEGTIFVASHDGDGPVVAAVHDAEFQWLDTLWNDGWRERLVAPAADPISSSDLRSQGWDAYDFELWADGAEPEDGVDLMRVRGMNMFTGETVTIDGVELQRTLYQNAYSYTDGKITAVGRGQQYFSLESGLFFLGVEDWIEDGETQTWDNTPVAFLTPGDEGFGSIAPSIECGDGEEAETDAGEPAKSSTGKQAN